MARPFAATTLQGTTGPEGLDPNADPQGRPGQHRHWSRQHISKPVIGLGASADEVMIDGWSKELAASMAQYGPDAKVVRQRLVFELQFGGGQALRYDKTLTGMDLDEVLSSKALVRRLDWATGRIDLRRLKPYMPAVGMNIAGDASPIPTTASEGCGLSRAHDAGGRGASPA